MNDAKVIDMNPWQELIKAKLIPMMKKDILGRAMPEYTGQINAGRSPLEEFATQLAGRRGTSGAPVQWGQANQFMDPSMGMGGQMAQMMFQQQMRGGGQGNPGVGSFINTYLNAYPQGWNPFSGMQPGNTGAPPWAQGGGGGGGGQMPPWMR